MRYRNTWAEIDLEAIKHNITVLRDNLPGSSKPIGVVKANAYGHGSVEVARTLIEAGVERLMVALLEEAIHLRKAGITVPIIVITRVAPMYAPIAAKYQITLTVFSDEWIKEAAKFEYETPLLTHLEFETGMGRTGLQTEKEIDRILQSYKEAEDIELEGVYTHFATADDVNSPYFMRQIERFEQLLAYLQKKHKKSLIVHTGNSAAGIQYPNKMHHYTRFGIATYGLYPSTGIKALENIRLKEAFSLHSELIQVKKVQAGECISYGATYCATEDEWIGTVPIGYADGWTRRLQGFNVLIDGKKHPIVGRICMDAMMIKLDEPYDVGTKVTLIGKNGKEFISVDDVAEYIDTINYEVTCMISSRVPREYGAL